VAVRIYDEFELETVILYKILDLFRVCARVDQTGFFGGRVCQEIGVYGKRPYDKLF
jgi:hypothetical protein